MNQKIGCGVKTLSGGLITAVTKNHFDCGNILIKSGANVNIVNRGEPVIVGAASNGNLEVMDLLIDAGADVNIRSSYGITALIGASCFGHDDCVQSLCRAGADVNATGRHNSTALIAAAVRGKSTCMKLLISAGADVNARDITGNTVLFEAAFSNNIACVQELLHAGARINELNNDGLNALKYHLIHRRTDQKEMAIYLFTAGEILDVRTIDRTDYWGNVTQVEVPEYLRLTELRLVLKHLCRSNQETFYTT